MSDSQPAPCANALDALDRLIASAPDLPKVRISGTVTEVTTAYCRVSGLSPFVKLGECIELNTGIPPQLGEIVRIDATGVTVKPFDTGMKAGLGTTARRRGFVTISPHVSWKGRIVNALGAPIDDAGPLLQGERPVFSDREPPPAMRRQRARTPLQTGVRVIDLFTPSVRGPAHRHIRRLRHRQVDAARHARPLPRFRHCRHWRWSANADVRCATFSRTR